VPAWLDGVLASLHVGGSGGEVVTCPRIAAGGTGVRAIETQTVGPTIEHVDAIVSDDMWCCCSRHGFDADGSIGTMSGRRLGDGHGGDGSGKQVCTVVANLGCHEFTQAFFVFVVEM